MLFLWWDLNLQPTQPVTASAIPAKLFGMWFVMEQMKFSLHHELQCAVADEVKHVEVCNKLCDIKSFILRVNHVDSYYFTHCTHL